MKPLFKVADGRHFTPQWIIEQFPEHSDYIEPFCENAVVFFNKPKSNITVLNDSSISILQSLRDEPAQFIKKLKSITYSEKVFLREQKKTSDSLGELILRKMSVGGVKQKFCDEPEQWAEMLAQLPEMAAKLEGVHLFNKSPVEIIRAFDSWNTLIYCTPPVDDAVFNTDNHIELCKALNRCDSKVVVHGFASPLYNRLYKEWKFVDKPSVKNKKTEGLWKNF